MIKVLQNQITKEKKCRFENKTIICSQFVNKNLQPPMPYGKELCLMSDECNHNECIYHNNYQE